ncbi:MAG: SMP-30/gluconolactonase/LRE family protein [Verrucomicrobiota bacterium]
MNSSKFFQLLAKRLLPAAAVLLGSAGLLSSSARAQTFVAEWAEVDIGRLGPTGLALDRVGGVTYLYAADSVNGRILKFDTATGTRVGVFGTTGFGPVQFNAPYGIAVDPVSHDIYVAERGNRRIHRITANGAFVMAWGEPGTGNNQFAAPVGIAADAAGNVYVADHGNNRIQKFNVTNSGGTWQANHVRTWGSLGAGLGQLNGPYGLALDAQGALWVADGGNSRVQKFDANGNYLSVIGWRGTATGQFITPTWVSFDSAGNMWVTETNSDPSNPLAADIGHQRIQKFNAAGTFVSSFGSLGENGGQFRLPFQIVVDVAGDSAYVSDYYNTRLQKFSLSGSTPPPPPPPPPPPTAAAARFVNLSSRLYTSDGDASQAFIAGFVVSGTTRKQMLVRAIGPGLAQFGVAGTLSNPRLRIYSGTTIVAENENWTNDVAMRTAQESVGAFALPAGSLDAGMLVVLEPGAYSLHVLANGGQGVALVEVYDAETSQPTKLVNLSTRGFVSTGDAVLVAGFVVQGTTPKRVLIRGIGPALAGFGVAGSLTDSTLKVYQGTTLVAQNDDWGTPQAVLGGGAPATGVEIAAAAAATGAFALGGGSRDASVVVTLAPGAYSAVVAGANNSTGAGLVEVYEMPTP